MYAIYFDYKNIVYRLPTNPEQIEMSTSQAVETFEVLKLGQIAVPTHMELKEYSFECEIPHEVYPYLLIRNKPVRAEDLLKIFETWRENLVPIRFIAGIGQDMLRFRLQKPSVIEGINTLVLIEEMKVTEKAGEEGDKYVSFKLLEYKEFGKRLGVIDKNKMEVKKLVLDKTNPKNTGHYVVKSGDTLWSIAKKYYGDGSKYTKIYNANKAIIKNPNLIYPGWKLVIP